LSVSVTTVTRLLTHSLTATRVTALFNQSINKFIFQATWLTGCYRSKH